MSNPSPMLSESPECVTAGDSAHVQIVKIGLGKDTVSIIVALMLIVAVCTYTIGRNFAKQDQLDRDFRDATVQAKLAERRLMDMEAYAMLNGWKVPKDDQHGPTGNLDRMNKRKE